MFSSSRNRNLVLVQEKVTVAGDFNDAVAWQNVGEPAWVSINPVRGREITRDEEVQSIVTHTVRGDYLEINHIKDEMRIVFNEEHEYDPISQNSIIFDVIAVMEDFDTRGDVMIQVERHNLTFGQTSTDVQR